MTLRHCCAREVIEIPTKKQNIKIDQKAFHFEDEKNDRFRRECRLILSIHRVSFHLPRFAFFDHLTALFILKTSALFIYYCCFARVEAKWQEDMYKQPIWRLSKHRKRSRDAIFSREFLLFSSSRHSNDCYWCWDGDSNEVWGNNCHKMRWKMKTKSRAEISQGNLSCARTQFIAALIIRALVIKIN